MPDIAFLPAAELARMLDSREVSSRELLDHYLDRIDRHDKAVNAVVTLDPERARADAVAADEEAVAGRRRGPLHGLPMTIKDAFETAGLRTTSGAPELADHVPERDADAVARLRSAGAIVFGKTNLPMYAGDLQSYNDVFGTTNNPWDLTRGPGGSSGGAAAALAAGLTGFELGSDIGGSIRNPAHFCGVFGLKPTYGIVPIRGHIPGPPGSLLEPDIGVAGPMGRSAEDLDLGLDVLAGPNGRVERGWRLELPPASVGSLKGLRVAAWLDDAHAPVDAAVKERLVQAAAAAAEAGAIVDDEARPPFSLEEADNTFQDVLLGVLCDGLPEASFDALVQLAEQLPPGDTSYLGRISRRITVRKRDWNRSAEAAEQLRAGWDSFFEAHDILLCPVVTVAAFPHDHAPDQGGRTLIVNGAPRPYFDAIIWAGLSGLPGLPAASAPVGRTPEGLPVGIQVIGRHLDDRTVVAVTGMLAEAAGGYEQPPGYES